MLILILIISIAYLLQLAIFLVGLSRNPDGKSRHEYPYVSVVIAARNEEKSLPFCLESVCEQTYPSDKYEVIVVDDGSTDNSKLICEKIALNHLNIKMISSRPDASLYGKANALACGIEESRGEIILITDADCIVQKTWIESTLARYDENIGLIGGFTLQTATGPFSGMQSLDWAFILGVAASTAGLHNPLGSIGNNLSFRRAAYDQIGGYRKLKFSVTEDYTIVQAIVGSKKWRYLYPLDPSHLVESKPCPDFITLLRQKHRWGKGGLDMKPAGFVIMIIGFSMSILPFLLLFSGGLLYSALMLTVKSAADYIFLNKVLSRLDKKDELRWFNWFELYFIIYVVLLPFVVFFGGKVSWKGRKF